jgi:hypothetical protein
VISSSKNNIGINQPSSKLSDRNGFGMKNNLVKNITLNMVDSIEKNILHEEGIGYLRTKMFNEL